jgi:hypothetical protein
MPSIAAVRRSLSFDSIVYRANAFGSHKRGQTLRKVGAVILRLAKLTIPTLHRALPPVFFDGRAASKIHFNFIFSKN